MAVTDIAVRDVTGTEFRAFTTVGISLRDTTPTVMRIAPEPLGIAYLWYSDTLAGSYRPEFDLPAEGVDAAPTGHVNGRYPIVVFPDYIDWNTIYAPTVVGNYTNSCPVGDLQLRIWNGNAWVLSPLSVYGHSSWHPGPLALYHDGEWLDVETLPA